MSGVHAGYSVREDGTVTLGGLILSDGVWSMEYGKGIGPSLFHVERGERAGIG